MYNFVSGLLTELSWLFLEGGAILIVALQFRNMIIYLHMVHLRNSEQIGGI